MNIANLEAVLQSFLRNTPEVTVLGYFGSYAKGTAKTTSDIDICIAEERPLSTEKKIQYINELTLLLKKEIDLVDLHAVNGVILKEALHTSKWVRKEPTSYAQILKRMLFDQADFQPYYQRMLKAKRDRFLKS
ncbi:nucleotidyltransferase domain-containing protein [Bdellovibrio bacteriovorus]|uniref:type VII toxin-antitoxin system MntA family adenylyltransferase antitoxin n=1 Tax=Bdellovibrio bacteriovorus TaxID=959 RepID=UPI0021D01C8C|nr:nucleotidyltransferase domain-containing protein [Bdellovibrio bacteriovorus]UXR63789.1 nucleotidyltransferase domain-containing protein [Bdellovibrio bacteriovorus]